MYTWLPRTFSDILLARRWCRCRAQGLMVDWRGYIHIFISYRMRNFSHNSARRDSRARKKVVLFITFSDRNLLCDGIPSQKLNRTQLNAFKWNYLSFNAACWFINSKYEKGGTRRERKELEMNYFVNVFSRWMCRADHQSTRVTN